MANKIKITTTELKDQAGRMDALNDRLDSIITQMNGALKKIDNSTCAKFSSNIIVKTAALRRNMQNARNYLLIGAAIAKKCAESYTNADTVIRQHVVNINTPEVQNTPPSDQKVGGTVYINENGYIPDKQWEEIIPHKMNKEGDRSPDVYKEVLDDLNVENRKRYQKGNGNTWCNIYVWDATKAMGCEVPHYYNPKTGEPLTREYCLQHPKEYYEMSAARMTSWLEKFGEKYGWIECDAQTATEMANKGYPTIIAATDTGHVGMVVPQEGGDTGVMVSQAGASNFNYGTQRKGFGNHSVKYFYHL